MTSKRLDSSLQFQGRSDSIPKESPQARVSQTRKTDRETLSQILKQVQTQTQSRRIRQSEVMGFFGKTGRYVNNKGRFIKEGGGFRAVINNNPIKVSNWQRIQLATLIKLS